MNKKYSSNTKIMLESKELLHNMVDEVFEAIEEYDDLKNKKRATRMRIDNLKDTLDIVMNMVIELK